MLTKAPELRAWLYETGLIQKMDDTAHIVWAAGGRLVPEEARKVFVEPHLV